MNLNKKREYRVTLHFTTCRGKRNDQPRAHGTRKKTHPHCCTAYSPTHSSIRQVSLRYYNITPPPQHKTNTSPHGHIIPRMRAPQDQPKSLGATRFEKRTGVPDRSNTKMTVLSETVSRRPKVGSGNYASASATKNASQFSTRRIPITHISIPSCTRATSDQPSLLA